MTRRFDSRVCRFVEFFIGKLAEKQDELDEDSEEEKKPEAPKYEQQSFVGEDGFMPVGDDIDLPFK